MAPRITDTRTSDRAIYIVCEGSKSEPWFLRRYIEWLQNRGWTINYTWEIFPAPKDEEPVAEDESNRLKKSSRKNKGRSLKETDEIVSEKEENPGGNPLEWVKHGVNKLAYYSEVYVVFDKDNHPKITADAS